MLLKRVSSHLPLLMADRRADAEGHFRSWGGLGAVAARGAWPRWALEWREVACLIWLVLSGCRPGGVCDARHCRGRTYHLVPQVR